MRKSVLKHEQISARKPSRPLLMGVAGVSAWRRSLGVCSDRSQSVVLSSHSIAIGAAESSLEAAAAAAVLIASGGVAADRAAAAWA